MGGRPGFACWPAAFAVSALVRHLAMRMQLDEKHLNLPVWAIRRWNTVFPVTGAQLSRGCLEEARQY
jgi:hypothetical protein